jgi:chorismate mutase
LTSNNHAFASVEAFVPGIEDRSGLIVWYLTSCPVVLLPDVIQVDDEGHSGASRSRRGRGVGAAGNRGVRIGFATMSEGDPMAELRRLRGSIDNMDAALVHLLAERFKITQQVGRLKAEYGLPPADPDREAEQISRLRALAETAKLDPEFAEKFLNFVVAEVVRHHESLARATRAGSDAR